MPKLSGWEKHSLHKHGGWRGQYDRMHRWYDRVVSAETPDQDFLLAFFQNCYALRDWLINTGTLNAKDLNSFVGQSGYMQMCRDLSNGSKHFKIDQAPRDQDFVILREYDGPSRPPRLTLLSNGDQMDLLDLAKKCLSEWDAFLSQHGLLPQED